MFRRAAALASAPVLAASALLVPSAASASAPDHACDSVPLTFTKSYTTGRGHWQTKGSLKVYDLCAAGAFPRQGLPPGHRWHHGRGLVAVHGERAVQA